MQRVISENEAQQVKQYYNKTADELGIARPLDSSGWYKVKAYLREKYSQGHPAEWSKQDTWLHVIACSDLVIDPIKKRKGFGSFIQPFAIWILSPSDRHGMVSEFFRILFLLFTSAAISLVLNQLSSYIFSYEFNANHIMGVMAFNTTLIGLFISSDTNVGTIALVIFLASINSLLNMNITEEIGKSAITTIGALFSGATFCYAIAIRR